MDIIKIGGPVLKAFFDKPNLFSILSKHSDPFILVHGGGNDVSDLAKKLGTPANYIEGERATNEDFLQILQMVLLGRVNPALVGGLLKVGVKAMGLSGIDMAMLSCEASDSRQNRAGKIVSLDRTLIEHLLKENILPVFAPFGLLPDKNPCFVQADMAAAKLCRIFKAKRLIYLSDRDGVLDEHGALIEKLPFDQLCKLTESKKVTGGIAGKCKAGIEFLSEPDQSAEVIIGNGIHEESLAELLSGRGRKTILTK